MCRETIFSCIDKFLDHGADPNAYYRSQYRNYEFYSAVHIADKFSERSKHDGGPLYNRVLTHFAILGAERRKMIEEDVE